MGYICHNDSTIINLENTGDSADVNHYTFFALLRIHSS